MDVTAHLLVEDGKIVLRITGRYLRDLCDFGFYEADPRQTHLVYDGVFPLRPERRSGCANMAHVSRLPTHRNLGHPSV